MTHHPARTLSDDGRLLLTAIRTLARFGTGVPVADIIELTGITARALGPAADEVIEKRLADSWEIGRERYLALTRRGAGLVQPVPDRQAWAARRAGSWPVGSKR